VRSLAESFPRPPRFLKIPGAGHSDVVQVGGGAVINEMINFMGRAWLAQLPFSDGSTAS
jgi:hypothetical protein